MQRNADTCGRILARLTRQRIIAAALVLCALTPAAAARSDTGHGSGGEQRDVRAGESEVRDPEQENRGRDRVRALGPDGRDIGGHGREAREPEGGAAGRTLDARTRAHATSATVLASLPDRWCGTARSADDTRHERDNGAWRFHAVYALAADGIDRFAARASAIQTDAFQASALLEKLYGRAIRFDMGTGCGPQFLDITVLRLAESTAALRDLAQAPAGALDAVARALDANGMPTAKTADTLEALRQNTRNYVVWLDAPAPKDACGQATMEPDTDRNPDTNRSNFGGNVAVVFRQRTGFCNSTAVRHEIGHTLGALRAGAPHAVDGAHCGDAYEDTMCVGAAPRIGLTPSEGFFDYGNDDYWSPPGRPLGWWTVDQSRFLCADVACNVPSSADGPPRLRTTVVRRAGDWALDMRATGAGKALLTVRCRSRRGAEFRTVRRRIVTPPARLRIRVRCFSQPRAALRAT
ncbi:MAG TPA: hypothetical protein VGJ32_08785 [Solirubrobacteraceae bacterium]|jgi:hypothetical protein